MVWHVSLYDKVWNSLLCSKKVIQSYLGPERFPGLPVHLCKHISVIVWFHVSFQQKLCPIDDAELRYFKGQVYITVLRQTDFSRCCSSLVSFLVIGAVCWSQLMISLISFSSSFVHVGVAYRTVWESLEITPNIVMMFGNSRYRCIVPSI